MATSSAALVSVSVQLPSASQITVLTRSAEAGITARPTSVVLHGDGSGEATLLGRRMVPNRAHPLPPFAVISTRGGANVTVSGEGSVCAEGTSSSSAIASASSVVTSATGLDADLAAIHEVLRAARRRYKASLVQQLEAARSPTGRQQSSPAAPVPCVLVVGRAHSGKSTLVKQLGNMLYEDLRSGTSSSDSTDVLAVVNGDVTGGSNSGTALPGAVSCEFIGAEAVQPLTYFVGATDVGTSAAYDRYLDVATFVSQGLDVLRLDAMGRAASAHTGNGLSTTESDAAAAAAADPRAAATSPPPAAMLASAGTLIDTVGIDDGVPNTFSIIRELSDVFKATHVVAVGTSKADANALYERLRASVTALRSVEILTYVPRASAAALGSSLGGRRAVARLERPITEYFAGSYHRPLAAHLQVFAVKELILLDALTFTVVSPSAALQGTLGAIPFRTPMQAIDAASVCGFVVVKEVGSESIALLCPSRGRLPSSIILVTGIPAPRRIMTSVTF